MLYHNFISQENSGFKKGFSLVEVLMTLLILSLVMVLMAPVITKKVLPKKSEGVIYTYKSGNNTTVDNVCFIGSSSDSLTSSKSCSEYTFTPPAGVGYVDITLVAGGGGGGGAAGGTIVKTTKDVTATDTSSGYAAFSKDKLRGVKINFLTSKGADGSAIDTGCHSATNLKYCGGKGGNSAVSIANLNVPEILFASTPSLSPASDTSGTIKTTITNTSGSELASIAINGAVTYSSSLTSATCSGGGCSVPDVNINPQVEGTIGSYVLSTEIAPALNSRVLQGGQGGISKVMGQYGSGGNGENNSLSACDAATLTCTESATGSKTGKSGLASYEYTIEHAGGPGGGGAGGTAVRIAGFPVSQGTTYVIRVGSGGTGGIAGVSGVGSSLSSASNNATVGTSGTGGISTSIWQRNANGTETLLFLVTGGEQGAYGSKNTDGDEMGAKGSAGRYFPRLASSSANNLTNYGFDTNVATKGATSNITLGGTSYNGIRVVYPYLSNLPYSTLNLNGANSVDGKLGGYTNFSTAVVNNIKVSVNGEEIDNSYNGLYRRTVSGNRTGYVGGLGGFSGLGTKAGCGGLFMGNANGLTSSSTNALLAGKFFFAAGSNVFDASSYYDNCSLSTPDGQRANFVLPDAISGSLGQAGSGGGGGGYKTSVGAGKGGDGQDGYLMINWRR